MSKGFAWSLVQVNWETWTRKTMLESLVQLKFKAPAFESLESRLVGLQGEKSDICLHLPCAYIRKKKKKCEEHMGFLRICNS